MRQLDTGNRTLSRDETGDALQRLDLFVVPQPQIFGSDAPVFGDGGGLGEYQPGTADGAATEMNQMPVVGQAIDTGVLTHRRHRDAIEQGQLTQGKGFKQQAHGDLSN